MEELCGQLQEHGGAAGEAPTPSNLQDNNSKRTVFRTLILEEGGRCGAGHTDQM